MKRTILSFGLALCVLGAPALAAPSRVDVPFNRMLKQMDATYARFAKQTDRRLESALRRIEILEREEASPERINAVIIETRIALEASAAALRVQLERFNTATDLVIDRHEQAALRERIVPTIDFDGLRRRADFRTDSLAARADLLLDEANDALDEQVPVEEMPEETF